MSVFSTRRLATLLALSALAACADSIPTEPSAMTGAARFRSIQSDENSGVSSLLAEINARLEAEGADYRVLKAEFLYDAASWDGVTSTIVIANNRWKGIGTEWVPNDLRRGGRLGVTYANAVGDTIGVNRVSQDNEPVFRGPGGTFPPIPYAQLRVQLNEGVNAWKNQACTRRPILLVEATPGTNADFFDDAVLGSPFITPPNAAGKRDTLPPARALPLQSDGKVVPYVQPADIVQAGWLGRAFFDRLSWPNGSGSIIGVTITTAFISGGQFTDVDNNNLADTRRAEVYYNTRFAWSGTGAPAHVDFYSVIAHETGHAFGLNHFGKVFVTRKDAEDDGGLNLTEIKYAPYAIMNAVYITGRNEIATMDVSMYCSIFGRDLK